jgi:hypothetical protein
MSTSNDPNVEAAKLIKEAKDTLNSMILSGMNIHDPNIRLPNIDRFVDCIVSAAMLQTVAIMGEAFNGTNASTDKSADTAAAHTCGRQCHCNES